jgi:acyl-homoserine-lactone acylase
MSMPRRGRSDRPRSRDVPHCPQKKVDILWDKYGVPHIFATDRESMFYAHGWAQMQNQANLLLPSTASLRGRPPSTGGPSNLELDRWVQLNGVPNARRRGTTRRTRHSALFRCLRAGHQRLREAHPEAIDATSA